MFRGILAAMSTPFHLPRRTTACPPSPIMSAGLSPTIRSAGSSSHALSSAAALEAFAGAWNAETVDEDSELPSVEEEAGVGTDLELVPCGWSFLDERFRRYQCSKEARPSTRTPPAPPPTAAAMGKPDELEDCGFDATIRGSERTVRPRAADALAAVPMLLERRLETAAAVVYEGTLSTAVMATEAARTEMVTSGTLTPAADAMADWRPLVSA